MGAGAVPAVRRSRIFRRPGEATVQATAATGHQPREKTRVIGITVPLGPLGVTVGFYRRGVFALAIGVRRWLR
jgi:hypothetical protein